ncbi:RagB/SusD family nutrient uptake outer membrane protein [Flavihumibacter rivuli]|uniref:RagB/SusD family nutrient uptake outer membrane protein n=1 Tax=Flavihumibacter rivuli TaxID=2838156 RepID=UPI001BDDCFBD|nr:RagB/SusD family nutrient uptake outer membrane protein [Flavihumibacter rivuli]ULQ55861.1 RagB/SusD family nutrient uptake outer membrane protein [Flavihumibacter rivuli]
MNVRICIPITLIAALALVVSSCQKFLEAKSDKTLVVPRTIMDLQGLLDDDYIMNSQTPGFSQSCDDDFFMTPDTYAAVSELERQVYTWRVEQYNFPNDWASAYNAVYNANYCLEQLGNIALTPANEAVWRNVKGSAHFYRGYYFLSLLWEFAKAYDPQTAATDPGIVLRLGSNFNTPSVRASVKDSYEQVIADLTRAAEYLPDNPVHPMRPSRLAAFAALARCYLSMNRYDSAYAYADRSLALRSELLDYNSPEVDAGSFTPFRPFNKEIIFYTTQSGNYSPKYFVFAYQDSLLYASYDNNDLRKTVFYFENGPYPSFKGHYTGDPFLFFSGITTAEVLLTRAEAHARLGRGVQAMADLNRLLEHRWKAGSFTPLSAANDQEALEQVLVERRKELTMRSLRWMDIKRQNKLGAGINLTRKLGPETYTLPANDRRFALPLPQDIINQTGMQQN